ncbi:hypothetical protein ES707_10118 [subsurface metagenome]
MSTIRKLRRTMVTQHGFGELQKPLCKIADLSEDARRFIRCLIREWWKDHPARRDCALDLDEAVQAIEENLEAGTLKIVVDKSPKTLAHFGSTQYNIVPAGKF